MWYDFISFHLCRKLTVWSPWNLFSFSNWSHAFRIHLQLIALRRKRFSTSKLTMFEEKKPGLIYCLRMISFFGIHFMYWSKSHKKEIQRVCRLALWYKNIWCFILWDFLILRQYTCTFYVFQLTMCVVFFMSMLSYIEVVAFLWICWWLFFFFF